MHTLAAASCPLPISRRLTALTLAPPMTSFASTLASGGIDEDYVRAQAMIESHWHQDCAAANGGNGCSGAGDLNNPAGCTNGLPVAPLTPDANSVRCRDLAGSRRPQSLRFVVDRSEQGLL